MYLQSVKSSLSEEAVLALGFAEREVGRGPTVRHPSWLCHFISNSCPELQAVSPSEIWGCRGGLNLLCGFLLRGGRLPS